MMNCYLRNDKEQERAFVIPSKPKVHNDIYAKCNKSADRQINRVSIRTQNMTPKLLDIVTELLTTESVCIQESWDSAFLIDVLTVAIYFKYDDVASELMTKLKK